MALVVLYCLVGLQLGQLRPAEDVEQRQVQHVVAGLKQKELDQGLTEARLRISLRLYVGRGYKQST